MTSHARRYLIAVTMLAFLIALGTQQLLASDRSWIGIYMQDVNADLAEAFDLSVKKGVLINDVLENSPAEKAGLKPKDVILAWNGKAIEDSQELTELVQDSRIGDQVKLAINRDGKEMDVAVVIGERKEPQLYGKSERHREALDLPFFGDARSTGIGVSMQSLSGKLGDYFGVPDGNGALITEVMKDTPAEKAGLKAGDVIVKVDGKGVEGPSNVSDLIRDKEKGDKVDLVIVRDKTEQTVALEVAEIESFGSALDMFYYMPRYHSEESLQPFMYRFDGKQDKNLQRKMEEMQEKLEEMQRKLESLESRVK